MTPQWPWIVAVIIMAVLGALWMMGVPILTRP